MTIQKVFVTGATGFIGRHMVRKLLDEGYTVGALARSSASLKEMEGCSSLQPFEGDLRNYEDLRKAFSAFRPDAVIHLVTYYAVMHRADEIGVMLDTNVKGTINLLEAAKESGTVELFLNTSTCAVYKPEDRLLKEEDALRPQNLYAMTKLQAEEACSYYAEAFGLPCVTLRLFPPYGPGDHDRRLIPYVIDSIIKNVPPNLTTGKQEWDFVYIDDIVWAFTATLKAAPFPDNHPVFNIGTGKAVSIRAVVEKIRTTIGSEIDLPWGSVPHRTNEVWFNSADSGKAERILGWKPETGIDDGIVLTVAWFKDYYQRKHG